MAAVQHIVGYGQHVMDVIGLKAPRAHCGARLRHGEGAAYDAPMCRKCMEVAGWTHDKRR